MPRRSRRPAPAPLHPRSFGALPLFPALLLAAASGLLLTWAFPAEDVWVLAFPALAGLLVALRGRGFWTGVVVGLAGGAAFWFPLIGWLTLFLGPVPLVALGSLQVAFFALGCGLVALAYRSVPFVWPSRWGTVGLTPLVVAAAWTAREVVAGTWPYGGFAWGRVSLSQSSGPFADLAAWFGLSGLSFVLVWLAAFAVAVLTEPPGSPAEPAGADLVRRTEPDPLRPTRYGLSPDPQDWAWPDARWWDRALPRLTAVALAALALVAIPAFRPTTEGVLRVGAVQANSKSGYFQRTDYVGQVLDQNVQASLPLVTDRVQLLVWPEGASDVSPLADASAAERWTQIASLTGAPLLAGAITERDGRFYNSSLLWRPEAGVVAAYDKVRPVPFAEYVPDRAFWTPFAPELLGLIGRDYTPGTRSPLMEVDGVVIGVDICFDIVDDGLITGSVRDGAQVLIAQTNNADFGDTEESRQQLAIARMRAIETGRSLVAVSTVAATAAFGPDGALLESVPAFRRGSMSVDLPVSTGRTPAVAFGVPLGAGLALFGVLAPLAAAVLARPLRRRA